MTMSPGDICNDSRSSVDSRESDPSVSGVSSHSHPAYRHHPTALASSSRLPNLPAPPPPDRLPPPKGRSVKDAGHRFKLGKKKSRTAASMPAEGRSSSINDEEWTFEGGGVGSYNGGSIPTISTSRASIDGFSSRGGEPGPMFDSQLTEVPAREKKMSKGRGLAKKTSRLFMRDKDRDRSTEKSGSGHNGGTYVESASSTGAITPESQSSLNLPGSNSRQTSYSSVMSGESTHSHLSNGSSSRRFGALTRPMTAHPNARSGASHSRRLSQDSHSSWQARSGRSSTSTYDSPIEGNHLPIPPRQHSNLSASVPGLSRNALPQPVLSPPSETAHTLPSRMSMWFSHLMPSSSANSGSTGPSEMGVVNGGAGYTSSPPRKGPSVAATFLNAARQKAVDGVRNLLDSEAQPDRCPDPIWLMGQGHLGYRPVTPLGSPAYENANLMENLDDEPKTARSANSVTKASPSKNDQASLKSAEGRKRDKTQPTSPSTNKGYSNLFSGSNTSLTLPAATSPGRQTDEKRTVAESPSKGRKAKVEKEVVKWPEQFYDDFRSIVWCTYRSQYAPILSLPPNLLVPSPGPYFSAFGPPIDATASLPAIPNHPPISGPRTSSSPWSWTRSEERGLTSDAGWGCMLRTGQSLLANALIHLHLGRDWRLPSSRPSSRPESPSQVAALKSYATYIQVVSWFLDDPSPLSPFSVHRMALIGKELGKEVGEWFGPSTAAGALKTLTNSFPLCGTAVATATDSIVYRSEVFAASSLLSEGWTEQDATASPSRSTTSRKSNTVWGDKAVLILIGIRLGLDGVNPIYYDSIKALFTFPQSVGIAGGRPSSSYYFVACQANSLFYLDPHFTRPAIPLVTPPAPSSKDRAAPSLASSLISESVKTNPAPAPPHSLDVINVDDVPSDDSESDTSSPSHRTRRDVSSPAAKRLSAHKRDLSIHSMTKTTPTTHRRTSSDPFGSSKVATAASPQHSVNSSSVTSGSPRQTKAKNPTLDAQDLWYASAYTEAQMKTFHCEKVRKMPLSGLDPSMLLGFLVKDEADLEDFCMRAAKLPQKIFTVQDAPPTWDDDELDSVSEPEEYHDHELEPEMDDLAQGVASSRFSPDFAVDDDNMSPITVSARDLPHRRADVDPRRGSLPSNEPVSEKPQSAADEDWDKGSGRGDSAPSTPPSGFTVRPLNDGKALAGASESRSSERPTISSTQSETDSWVGIPGHREADQLARTVTPPPPGALFDDPETPTLERAAAEPLSAAKKQHISENT